MVGKAHFEGNMQIALDDLDESYSEERYQKSIKESITRVYNSTVCCYTQSAGYK